jgi:hypothetical protein
MCEVSRLTGQQANLGRGKRVAGNVPMALPICSQTVFPASLSLSLMKFTSWKPPNRASDEFLDIFPGFPFFKKLTNFIAFVNHFAFDGSGCFLGIRQFGSGLNADTFAGISGGRWRNVFTFFTCRHEKRLLCNAEI